MKIKEIQDVLCEMSIDKPLYLVTTHIIGTKEAGESYNVKHPRYITLDKEKAKRYMEACAEHVKTLSQAHSDEYFVHEITDTKILYSAHNEELTCIMTIYMEEWNLDYALSEF